MLQFNPSIFLFVFLLFWIISLYIFQELSQYIFQELSWFLECLICFTPTLILLARILPLTCSFTTVPTNMLGNIVDSSSFAMVTIMFEQNLFPGCLQCHSLCKCTCMCPKEWLHISLKSWVPRLFLFVSVTLVNYWKAAVQAKKTRHQAVGIPNEREHKYYVYTRVVHPA